MLPLHRLGKKVNSVSLFNIYIYIYIYYYLAWRLVGYYKVLGVVLG